jgi:hypothetical protein
LRFSRLAAQGEDISEDYFKEILIERIGQAKSGFRGSPLERYAVAVQRG